MVNFIQPLDLHTLLVNLLAGSDTIFIFLALIFIAALSARFRMPNVIFLVMFSVFTIFMANYFPGLYAFSIIIVGMIVIYNLGRIVAR